MDHILLIHSLTDRYLGCFYLLVILNSTESTLYEHGYTNICLGSCFQFFWVYTLPTERKMHNVKVVSQVLFRDLTVDSSLECSLSDTSEKLL